MVVKRIQIYGVHVSWKCICKSKKFKVDLFTTLFGSYHHLLGRDKLLIPRSQGGGLWKPISILLYINFSTYNSVLFLDFFDLHYISLRLLVPAGFMNYWLLLLEYEIIKLLLNVRLLQMRICDKQRYNFSRIYRCINV